MVPIKTWVICDQQVRQPQYSKAFNNLGKIYKVLDICSMAVVPWMKLYILSQNLLQVLVSVSEYLWKKKH